MPDRLAELVRQRALVQEHLAWLNREIAAAAEAAKVMPAPGTAPAASVPPPAPTDAAPSAMPASGPAPDVSPALDGDEIIAQYQVSPVALKQDIRKGCLLYFAGAFLLLGLVVFVLYFALRHSP